MFCQLYLNKAGEKNLSSWLKMVCKKHLLINRLNLKLETIYDYVSQ